MPTHAWMGITNIKAQLILLAFSWFLTWQIRCAYESLIDLTKSRGLAYFMVKTTNTSSLEHAYRVIIIGMYLTSAHDNMKSDNKTINRSKPRFTLDVMTLLEWSQKTKEALEQHLLTGNTEQLGYVSSVAHTVNEA